MYSLEELKTLIQLIDSSNVGELFIEDESFTIRIRTKDYVAKHTVATAPVMATAPTPAAITAPVPAASPVSTLIAEKASDGTAADNNTPFSTDDKYIEVKSPMIGTFYRASSPDSPPFVKVGDTIKKGDVLGVIEAMKLFNEIHSEYEGVVVRVIADNASPVEYDQVLFWIQ